MSEKRSNSEHEFLSDSLDVIELVMELETEFGISISDEDYEKIHTARDAREFFESRLGVCPLQLKPVQKVRRWPQYISRCSVWALALVVIYVLSTGPFVRVATRADSVTSYLNAVKLYDTIYWPITEACAHSKVVDEIFNEYLELWRAH